MVEILPAINCELNDDAGVLKKLDAVKQFAEWVHLDVADGVFTFAPSWGFPMAWHALMAKEKYSMKLEVHLMVEHPERVVQEWIDAGAKRIIVHYEAFPQKRANQQTLRRIAFAGIVERCRHAGVEAILAVNPETSLAVTAEYLSHFDGFQVFSQAHPGPSGQKFLPSVLPKITALRQQFPNATIEVDGGMNLETATRAVRAGANALAVGTYIYTAPDPKTAYETLRSLA